MTAPQQLGWSVDARRWYLGNHPIYAGSTLLVFLPSDVAADLPRRWLEFRVESERAGRVLFLVYYAHGLEWRLPLSFDPSEAGYADREPIAQANLPQLAVPGSRHQ